MKNKKRIVEKAAGIWSSTTNAGTGQGFYSGLASDWQLLSLYVNNPVVHACISKIANAVASTPFQLIQTPIQKPNNRKPLPPTVITQHPILDLLSNQTEMLHASDFFRLISTYINVCGRAYLYMERDTVTAKPQVLKLLQPYWVEPYRNPDGTVNSYFYMNGMSMDRRQKVQIMPDDMIVLGYASPSDPYSGSGDSPLRSAWQIASLSNKFTQYISTIFDNRSRPDQMFISGSDISADEAKVLEKKINDKFRGTGNGKTLIVEHQGKMVPLSYQPQDLAVLKIDHELKINLCNALHIPICLLDDNPNRAGIEGALKDFESYAVQPMIHLIQEKLNRKLCPPFGENIKIVFSPCVTEDAVFAAQQRQQQVENNLNSFKSGAMSINEFRATINLPPIVNGDDIILPPATTPQSPEGLPEDIEPEPVAEPEPTPEPAKQIDVNLIMSINSKVYSRELPRAVGISLASVATGLPESDVKNLIGYPQADTACPCGACQNKAGVTSTEATVSQPEASNEAKSEDIREDSPKIGCPVPEGEELVEPMLRLYEFAHIAISEQIPAIAARIEASGISAAKAADLPDNTNQDMPQDDNFIYVDQWDERVSKKIIPVIEVYADQGLKYFLSRVGGDPALPAVVPQKINEAMRLSTMKLAQSTMQTTLHDVNTAKNMLREEIKQGTFQGDTVKELGKRVNSVFAGLDKVHAKMIAQTESSRAVHNGLRIAAEESGLVSGFKFVASSDACPICLGLDGQTTTINKQFIPNDYDNSLLPIHPNCRCTMTEILK